MNAALWVIVALLALILITTARAMRYLATILWEIRNLSPGHQARLAAFRDEFIARAERAARAEARFGASAEPPSSPET